MKKIEYEQLKTYDLKKKLGIGAGGAVYLGEYNRDVVAIKLIPGDIDKEAAIMNEANYQQMVNSHKNSVKLLGISSFNGDTLLVMEYMAGGSLSHLMHKSRIKYSRAEGVRWLSQAAQALAYLHASSVRGHVHRDVKPSNMLLDSELKILKMCDYGLGRNVATIMTKDTGTNLYMAPEVMEGNKYNEKCDVYSMAISICEVMTRKEPYKDEIKKFKLINVIKKIVEEDLRPRIDAEIPEYIQQLIQRCWDKDFEKRPCMQEIVDILRKPCTDASIPPFPPIENTQQ